MRSITMEQVNLDDREKGHIQAKVSTSDLLPKGKYGVCVDITITTCCRLRKMPVGCETAVEIIQKRFDASINRSAWIIDQVMAPGIKGKDMAITAVRDDLKNDTSGYNSPELDYFISLIKDKVSHRDDSAKADIEDLSTSAWGGAPTIADLQTSDIKLRHLDIPFIPVKKLFLDRHLQLLQEWEGYVTEIFEDTFSAELIDITADEDVAREEAEFPLADVDDGDKSLLRPGAVFRWTIGYLVSQTGGKKRVSQVVFRQLPQWTKRDLDQADKRGQGNRRSNYLGMISSNPPEAGELEITLIDPGFGESIVIHLGSKPMGGYRLMPRLKVR